MKISHEEKNTIIRQFRETICLYPSIEIILNDLEHFYESSEIGGNPLSMLITGESGTGKTSLINHFIKKKICTKTGQAPILSTTAQNTPEDLTRSMLSDLNILGNSFSTRKKTDHHLTNRLIFSIKDSGIRLIIIDKSHKFIEYQTPKERQLTYNRLRLISESTENPIIFIGKPWAEEIKQDPEWASLLATRSRSVEYFSITKNPREYRDFMQKLKAQLPVQRSQEMTFLEEDLRIFAATCGEQRHIKNLIENAYRLCWAQEQPISLKIYDEAYRNLYPASDYQPFQGELEKVNFREIEMSSRYIRGDSMYPAHIEPAKLSQYYSLSELLSKS